MVADCQSGNNQQLHRRPGRVSWTSPVTMFKVLQHCSVSNVLVDLPWFSLNSLVCLLRSCSHGSRTLNLIRSICRGHTCKLKCPYLKLQWLPEIILLSEQLVVTGSDDRSEIEMRNSVRRACARCLVVYTYTIRGFRAQFAVEIQPME